MYVHLPLMSPSPIKLVTPTEVHIQSSPIHTSQLIFTARIGQNTLTVYAKDHNNIIGSTTIRFTVVDSIPPVVQVIPQTYSKVDQRLAADVFDITNPLNPSCEVCIGEDCIWTSVGVTSLIGDGDIRGRCTYMWNNNHLNEGNYSYNFRVYDESGNLGVGEAKYTVLDKFAPNKINNIRVNPINGQSALTVRWKKNNAHDFSNYRIYRSLSRFDSVNRASLIAEPSSASTQAYTDSDLTELETYHYAVTAVDFAGNEKSEVISVEGTVNDLTAPDVTILSPLKKTYTTRTIELEFLVNEESECKYSLNQNNYIDVVSPTEFTAREGVNTINVWCFDETENIGTDSVTFTTDTMPPPLPQITLNTEDNMREIIISWTETPDSDFYKYSVFKSEQEFDNVELMVPIFQQYSKTLTSYVDNRVDLEKDYYYAVTVSDIRLNENSQVISKKARIDDTIIPQVTIMYPKQDETYNSKSVTLSYYPSEESICTYRINNNPEIEVSGHAVVEANEGSNSLAVSCTDNGENTGLSQVEFMVDTAPPQPITGLGLVTTDDGIEVSWDRF